MWKWRFIQMTSHLSASHRRKKREGGCQRVLRNLIFSDKITNNLLIPRSLSVWLSLSLSHSNGSTHTHKHTHQRSAVSKVPWQSITAVETAQVLCMRKMLAKTSMRIWTLHTQSTVTQHYSRFSLLSVRCSCQTFAAAKAIRIMSLSATRDYEV